MPKIASKAPDARREAQSGLFLTALSGNPLGNTWSLDL